MKVAFLVGMEPSSAQQELVVEGSDKALMTRLRTEHPELVEAEHKHYLNRDAHMAKKMSTAVVASTVVDLESDSSSSLGLLFDIDEE
jgi:hypothetical protein